jgi:hypothetical protein
MSLERVRRIARMCMDVYEDGCPIPAGSFMPLIKTVRMTGLVSVPQQFETEQQKYELLRSIVAEITRRQSRAHAIVYDA